MFITTGSTIFDADSNEYIVKEPLGQGGFGHVFLVERAGEKFALKTLPGSLSDPKLLEGLINEASNAEGIDGENVIKYIYFHDGKTFDNLPPYILMEYADGGTLRELIETNQLDVTSALAILSQLVKGMTIINSKMVHRDLKPENILIKDGVIKISDFGLSKLVEDSTRTRTFKGYGTPLYMSPEAWNNSANTMSMDIYSMGIIFSELLTGKFPFDYDPQDLDSLRNAHLYKNITPPNEVDSDIELCVSQLVIKMTQKNPTRRPTNWEEIEDSLNSKANTQSKYAGIINDITKNKITFDTQKEKENLERKQAEDSENDYKKKVYFQFEDEVIKPFQEFLNELQPSFEEKLNIAKQSDGRYTFNIFQRGIIRTEFTPLFDRDFEKEFPSDWGHGRTYRKVMRPTYNGELIWGWGKVAADRGNGFNIILFGNPEENFGKWVMTRSTNSAMARQGSHTKLPEPFAFDMNELEREVGAFGAMHIYNTQRVDLGIDYFADLVNRLISN